VTPGPVGFRAAGGTDVARLRRTLIAAAAFHDDAELEAAWRADPWRIQVTERGDAAVLTRWRDHLDVLAVEALWCRERDITGAVVELGDLARARGYGDLLGPPVPLEQAAPYEAAGMRIFETVTTFRRATRTEGAPGSAAVAGVTVRGAAAGDIEALLAIDAGCFGAFWRYDRTNMTRFLRTQRVAVAVGAEGPIGYTLSTVSRGDGLLGRVAVTPGSRGRGVGRALVTDVLDALREQGVGQVALCTQTDNEAARALYRACGFEDVGQPVVFMRFGG
jgi:ribosomal protein S18 acetylase RimI-like enzyme